MLKRENNLSFLFEVAAARVEEGRNKMRPYPPSPSLPLLLSSPFSSKLEKRCFWSPFKINRRYKAARVSSVGIFPFSRTFNPGKQSRAVAVWNATNRGGSHRPAVRLNILPLSLSLLLLLSRALASIPPAWNDPGKKPFPRDLVVGFAWARGWKQWRKWERITRVSSVSWHLHKAERGERSDREGSSPPFYLSIINSLSLLRGERERGTNDFQFYFSSEDGVDVDTYSATRPRAKASFPPLPRGS